MLKVSNKPTDWILVKTYTSGDGNAEPEFVLLLTCPDFIERITQCMHIIDNNKEMFAGAANFISVRVGNWCWWLPDTPDMQEMLEGVERKMIDGDYIYLKPIDWDELMKLLDTAVSQAGDSTDCENMQINNHGIVFTAYTKHGGQYLTSHELQLNAIFTQQVMEVDNV